MEQGLNFNFQVILEEYSARALFMNSQKLVEAALSNAVILDKIFDFHASPKILRLVCKTWNDVIMCGKPRLTLNLQSLPCRGRSNHGFTTMLDTLDSRLVKSLSLGTGSKFIHVGVEFNLGNFRVVETGSSQDDTSGPRKLLQICNKFGSHIQKLEILWWAEIIPTLRTIFGNGSVPNLKTLRIQFKNSQRKPSNLTLDGQELFQIIPPQPKLTMIKLILVSEEKVTALITTFFRDLIAAAPNLFYLHMASPFIPGLGSNKMLKTLRFMWQSQSMTMAENMAGMTPLQIFNLTSFSNVIDEVKESLELLELNTTGPVNSDIPFLLPVMPKLVTFINKNSSVFKISSTMREFWGDRLPRLTNLRISLDGIDVERELDLGMEGHGNLQVVMKLQNDGVTSLGLMGVDEASIGLLGRLQDLFPRLLSLDILLTPQYDESQEKGHSIMVGEAIKQCAQLELDHLSVKTGCSFGISEMVKALWEVKYELFTGLKTFAIINAEDPQTMITDDLSWDGQSMFQEALWMSKRMDKVILQGFLLRVGHGKRLLEFIKKHKLPIIFVN